MCKVMSMSFNKIHDIARTLVFDLISLFYFVIRAKDFYRCPICNYYGPFVTINPETGKRKYAKCPKCKSLERHRLQYLVFKEISKSVNINKMKVLHFAPEECFRDIFKRKFKEYMTADLNREDVDFKEDLTDYIKDKNVWDVGCSGGEFCRLSIDSGASRVLGIDYPEVIEGAFEASNYLGYYNIDWLGIDLLKEDIICDFEPDIIFFMSMNRHIGLPKFLKKAKTIIYEHNGDGPVEEVLKQFKVIKDLNQTGEDGRHTYILENL